MITELQERWLFALESGEYNQTKGFLQDEKGNCCLGVACRVMGYPVHIDRKEEDCIRNIHIHPNFYRGSDGLHWLTMEVMPSPAWELLGLRDASGIFENRIEYNGRHYWGLSAMNDWGLTFKEIAAFIRANPEVVFKEIQNEV